MMADIVASKRIDIEKGAYSPFTLPLAVFRKQAGCRWFILANTSAPLIATIAVVFGSSVSKHSPDIAGLVGAVCGYVAIVLSIGCIRAGLGEYSWVRRWEKETGRKMYISYVVDWKRYKEEEERRRQAERN